MTLLTVSFLISEDFGLSLEIPSDRSIFSTFVGGCNKHTAVAEKDRKTQKPTLIGKEKVNKGH